MSQGENPWSVVVFKVSKFKTCMCELPKIKQQSKVFKKNVDAFKVLLYSFDLISDQVNGALMLVGTPEVNHTNKCNMTTDNGAPHYYWGSITIGLTWVPALIGLGYILISIRYSGKWIWRDIYLFNPCSLHSMASSCAINDVSTYVTIHAQRGNEIFDGKK